MNNFKFASRSNNNRPSSPVDLKAGLRAIARAIHNSTDHPVELTSQSEILLEGNFNIMTENGTRTGAIAYPISRMPRLWSGRNPLVEPGVKKIAVLRSNGIGDFIFTLPALEALRNAYPAAEIVLLALDWHADFLRKRPSPIDRVVVLPRMQGLDSSPNTNENPQEVERFFEKMRQEEFDIAIQMHGGGKFSNPLIRRLGARLTAGSCAEGVLPLDRCVPYHFYHMEVLRYLEVVSLVGAFTTNLEPRIFVTDADLQAAGQFAPESPEPLAVIHPGAGDPRRRWPVQQFASVGTALAKAGARVIVVGSGGEPEIAQGVCSAMQADCLNLYGKLDLNALAGLLSRASLVVSNDSGPLHLAAAVGAPTVGIYWCGNMINAGPLTRARHRPAISWRLDCPVCGLDCTRTNCGHSESFVADVPQAEVIGSALDLLHIAQTHVRYTPAAKHSIEGDY
jgi:ADP-heptose:LPS heptosyltransferase